MGIETDLAAQVLRQVVGADKLADGLADMLAPTLSDLLSLGGPVRDALGLTGPRAATQIARLADVLAGAVPDGLRRELRELLAAGPAATADAADEPGEQQVTTTRVWERLRKAAVDAPDAAGPLLAEFMDSMSDVLDGLGELTALAAAGPPGGGPQGGGPQGGGPQGGGPQGGGPQGGGGGSNRWDPGRLVRRLAALIRAWTTAFGASGRLGRNVRRAADEILAELEGPFMERYLAAGALSIGGLLATGNIEWKEILLGRAPTSKLGVAVHQELQQEYRSHPLRFKHLVVQESWVWRRGRRTRIRAAARSNDDLQALYAARDRWLLIGRRWAKQVPRAVGENLENDLNSDNIDFSIGKIWEIKPVRGAALGVVQEFGYRVLYNFYVAWLKDIDVVRRFLGIRGRPPRFTVERLRSGTAMEWPSHGASWLGANPYVHVIDGRTVLVVGLDSLEGLVLYLVFDVPPALLLPLAKFIQSWLDSLVGEIRANLRRLGQIIATALNAIAAMLAFILLAALIAAVLFKAVVTSPAWAPIVAVLLVLGVSAEALGRLAEQLDGVVRPLVEKHGFALRRLSIPGDGTVRLDFALTGDPSQLELPRGAVSVGSLRLHDFPYALVPSLEPLFALATAVAGGLLNRPRPAGTA